MARPKLEPPTTGSSSAEVVTMSAGGQNGAWQRVSTGETDKRRATIWLAQFVAGRGTPIPPEQPTVSMILDGYLADRKPRVRAYDTLETAAKALRRHLGDLQPAHLTKERARFYARQRRAEGHIVGPATARRKKPTSDGTVIRELVTLRAALKWARAERWITDVPQIETPRQPAPRDRWLTREEADRLLASAQAPHVKTFLATCLYTGARAGAVLELTWDRIDLDARPIDLGAGGRRQGKSGRTDRRHAAADPEGSASCCNLSLRGRARRRPRGQRQDRHPGRGSARQPARRNTARPSPHGGNLDGDERCADGRDCPRPGP